jgi:uncharacterized protein (DUF58 family)
MTTLTTSRFLDLRALSALEHLRFTTRHHIEGSYSGRHPSRQQGGAGEFVDFREYSGSEDLRRLDWKVLGRSGKAIVRLYQDETNLNCTLAIDASGSMDFGKHDSSARKGKASAGVKGDSPIFAAQKSGQSPSKLEYVQYLATALSHVIVHGQDQVGLALLNHKLRDYMPPGGTLSHLRLLQEKIERLEVQPTQRMSQGLRDLFECSKRRGVLLLLSDFLMEDMEDVFSAVRLFRHRAWEVIVLHVVHPQEERLPEGTAFRFIGMEDEGSVNCTPAEIRSLYRERFSAHLAMVRQLALAGGCDYRRASTAIPYLQVLGGFLVERNT